MATTESSSSLLRALKDHARRIRRSLARSLLHRILAEARLPVELHAGDAPADTAVLNTAGVRPTDGLSPWSADSADPPRAAAAGCPSTSGAGDPHDGVSAMLSILAALEGGDRVSFEEVHQITGLDAGRLRGHAMSLREDGYLHFEHEETLRLTHSGEAALENLNVERSHG